MQLTHLNAHGEANMVDVGDKRETRREAVASGRIVMQPNTLQLLSDGALPKGDVLATARIAGIQAAKRTHELIPLCHSLALSKVAVDFDIDRTEAHGKHEPGNVYPQVFLGLQLHRGVDVVATESRNVFGPQGISPAVDLRDEPFFVKFDPCLGDGLAAERGLVAEGMVVDAVKELRETEVDGVRLQAHGINR